MKKSDKSTQVYCALAYVGIYSKWQLKVFLLWYSSYAKKTRFENLATITNFKKNLLVKFCPNSKDIFEKKLLKISKRFFKKIILIS